MINIAFIIDTIATPAAGTEKQLLMLINEIDKSRFKPYLICLHNSEWLNDNDLPFEVYILDVHSIISFGFIRGLIRFGKLHKEKNFDIVQTFFADGNIFGTVAAYVSGIKTNISSRRNHGGGHWHNKTWLFILRRLNRFTKLYISNSHSVAEYTSKAEHVEIDKIITIHNGLYLDEFKQITLQLREENRKRLSIEKDDILVCLIANWRPVKNYPLFIQVATMLHDKYPFTKFIIIGELPPNDVLQRYLLDYNIDDVVTFFGPTRDTIDILSAMDIGVLCSKAESLSNAILEYLASGLPCVVSQVGGNTEAIGYGKCGLSFESDNLHEFYRQLELLINDSGLRDRFARAGKTLVNQRFSYRIMVEKYEDLYESLV